MPKRRTAGPLLEETLDRRVRAQVSRERRESFTAHLRDLSYSGVIVRKRATKKESRQQG